MQYFYLHFVICIVVGNVPSSLCDIPVLNYIYITRYNSNPLVRCASLCLTTVNQRILPSTVFETCPSIQDYGLCGFIAATNIESLTNYNEWSCTTGGLTSTDPCNIAKWTGVTCMNGFINSISLNVSNMTGIIPTALGSLSTLSNLAFVNSLLSGINFIY